MSSSRRSISERKKSITTGDVWFKDVDPETGPLMLLLLFSVVFESEILKKKITKNAKKKNERFGKDITLSI
tara:strand:+ start:182 stop:394 length:213 start_codon:yes stop_codon:yes gene_type:complete